MAAITAAMVKELRESTGAGMMECKKALTQTDGDNGAAVDCYKKRGTVVRRKTPKSTRKTKVSTPRR